MKNYIKNETYVFIPFDFKFYILNFPFINSKFY